MRLGGICVFCYFISMSRVINLIFCLFLHCVKRGERPDVPDVGKGLVALAELQRPGGEFLQVFVSRLSSKFLGIWVFWVFWVFLVISGRKPRLYSKISDFQNLSVLGDLYALYHFVCHRYT